MSCCCLVNFGCIFNLYCGENFANIIMFFRLVIPDWIDFGCILIMLALMNAKIKHECMNIE